MNFFFKKIRLFVALIVCLVSLTAQAFEIVIGGEQGEPWEAYAHVVDGSDQNGYLVQSFSQRTDSSVACGDYCQERDIHSVIAATPDELKASYSDDSAWHGLYPRDGDHVIRFFADGRNNSDEGVGGGPSHGRWSYRTELSDNRTAGSFTNGDERYYTISFWAPKEIWNVATKRSTVISQWKQFGGGNPNFEVRLSLGNYALSLRSVEHNVAQTWIGTFVPDQWNDLKYYVKNSEGSDGVLKVWLNGELVYSYNGVTLYKSNEDGYIKFGMYTEFRDERVLLVDAVRIADSLNGKTMEEWSKDQAHLPSVTMTAPSNGAQINAGDSVLIKATASDPAGRQYGSPGEVTSVSFYADDVLLSTVSEAPFEFHWTPETEGEYEVTARVTDADGNQSTSSTITVFAGNRPPAVDLTSHTDFDNVPLGVASTLEATASDPDGTVESVSFFADGVLIAVDTTAPFAVSWTPSEKREYLVTARALDGEGGVGADSAAVSAGSVVTSVALIATDDAAIKSNYPDQVNNYSNVTIESTYDTTAGLFGFDIGELAADVGIKDATLTLTSASLSGNMRLSIFSAEGDWDETATWNKAPTRADSRLAFKDLTSIGEYTFDVRAAVRSAIDSSVSSLSFWAEDTSRSRNRLEIRSRARSEGKPRLDLSLTDIKVTLAEGDTEAPSQPANLTATNLDDGAVSLDWDDSTDNIGVVDHVVFVNGAFNQIVSASSATLSGLNSEIDNIVTVTARDPAGNSSPLSLPLTISATVIDSDGDGVPDVSDAFPNDPGEWIDTDGDGTGNNADSDDDNDGTPDNADAFPLDATEWLDSDTDGIGNNADLDDDNDGLSDIEEAQLGTNPLLRDTDADGWSDKEEIEDGSDPLSSASQPEVGSGLPIWLLYQATQ